MEPAVKTAVTAFHYRSLVLLEKMARHQGKSTEARKFAAMAEQTKKAVNEQLWDEARGCYVDGLDPESGKVSSHASAHANFFPLALGLVPEDRVSRVAAYLKQRGMACSVYGAQFLLDGLYDAGEADHALSLLVSRGKRSWLNMSEKVGSTITLEAWDPSLKPNLDWNHAWGAAPSNIIARRLMGIEPLEPGFKKFRVKPQTASLEKARIKMPTPRGPVLLEIRGKEAASWVAKLSVPAWTTAEFHLPFPGEAVTEGAAKPSPLPSEDGRKILRLEPGNWVIRMRK
jgi:alpha-L-rhamnosidase